MMTRACRRFVPILAAAALAFAGDGNPQQSPQYKAAVSLVVLDAVVTDRSGRYPADLRREDFEIYEDGVLQKIQDFRRVHTELPPAARPAPSVGRAPGPAAVTEPPRLFLLMIDDLSSRWSNLYQVTEALERLIAASLLPQDLMAIATMSHSGGLLQTFTNDRQALLAAARRALGLSLRGTGAAARTEKAVRDTAQAPSPFESACLYTGLPESSQIDTTAWRDAARIFSLENDFSARGMLYTLQSVCRALGALKGRKTVILVSEGFAISETVRPALPKLIDAANRANVAIYTVNPRGMEQVDPGQPVRLTQPSQATTFASAGMVVAGNSAFDLVRMENRANSLEDCLGEIAAATGGVTLRNTNEFFRGLEQALKDAHSYYELTYVPANQAADGRFRRIEVRLAPRLRGYHVRARGGYYAVASASSAAGSAEAQMSQALYDANLLDDLQAEIVPAYFAGPRGESLARVTLTLRPESVTLRDDGGRRTAEFKLLAAVFDETGALVRDIRQDYRLSLDESNLGAFLQEGATLAMDFALPPGTYQLKTVIREEPSGRMGSRRNVLEMASFCAGRPAISTIVLAQRQLAASAANSEARETYDPLRMGDAIWVPALPGSFARAGYLTAFFHVYDVSDPDDPSRSSYRYRMNLYRGETLVGSSDPKPVAGGARHPWNGFLLAPRLSLAALEPASYRLEVQLELPDGSTRAARSVSFTVR